MDEACCGEEWLGYEEDFVIKSLHKYAIMRLKQPEIGATLQVLAKHSSRQKGLQMDQTALIRNDYYCGFCCLPMGETHCFGCGRYDGAMTYTEYMNYLKVTGQL